MSGLRRRRIKKPQHSVRSGHAPMVTDTRAAVREVERGVPDVDDSKFSAVDFETESVDSTCEMEPITQLLGSQNTEQRANLLLSPVKQNGRVSLPPPPWKSPTERMSDTQVIHASEGSQQPSAKPKEDDIVKTDAKPKQETDDYQSHKQLLSANELWWFSLKVTAVRCLLMAVIFFVLQHFANRLVLDRVLRRGAHAYDSAAMRRAHMRENILKHVCPPGALECDFDFSNLDNFDFDIP